MWASSPAGRGQVGSDRRPHFRLTQTTMASARHSGQQRLTTNLKQAPLAIVWSCALGVSAYATAVNLVVVPEQVCPTC